MPYILVDCAVAHRQGPRPHSNGPNFGGNIASFLRGVPHEVETLTDDVSSALRSATLAHNIIILVLIQKNVVVLSF